MNVETRQVWFFVHVPKCAGMTVETHINRHLRASEVLKPVRSGPPALFARSVTYSTPTSTDYQQVRAVIGHEFGQSLKLRFQGAKVHECVMIRNPVDYFVSHYNFQMNNYIKRGLKTHSFDLWYRYRPLNPMAYFLLNRYLEIPKVNLWRLSSREKLNILDAALLDFTFVADLGYCNSFVDEISSRMGIGSDAQSKNISTNKLVTKSDLPGHLIERITKENDLDNAIYEKYRDRCWNPDAIHSFHSVLSSSSIPAIRKDIFRPIYKMIAHHL